MSDHFIPLWYYPILPFIFMYGLTQRFPLFFAAVTFIAGFSVRWIFWG